MHVAVRRLVPRRWRQKSVQWLHWKVAGKGGHYRYAPHMPEARTAILVHFQRPCVINSFGRSRQQRHAAFPLMLCLRTLMHTCVLLCCIGLLLLLPPLLRLLLRLLLLLRSHLALPLSFFSRLLVHMRSHLLVLVTKPAQPISHRRTANVHLVRLWGRLLCHSSLRHLWRQWRLL